MADLVQKYTPVIDKIEELGGNVADASVQGDKLHLKATVPSDIAKSKVWDTIKSVDSTYADLDHDITSEGKAQVYVIKPGDSLSKIAKEFYGNANDYQKIAEANGIEDPNKIRAGQSISIPA
jgi:nucleoid-associated protein YgaU